MHEKIASYHFAPKIFEFISKNTSIIRFRIKKKNPLLHNENFRARKIPIEYHKKYFVACHLPCACTKASGKVATRMMNISAREFSIVPLLKQIYQQQ